MRDFAEFRESVLTDDNLKEMTRLAKQCADKATGTNEHNWMASFSATFTLQMLNEYHRWLHQDQE